MSSTSNSFLGYKCCRDIPQAASGGSLQGSVVVLVVVVVEVDEVDVSVDVVQPAIEHVDVVTELDNVESVENSVISIVTASVWGLSI